MQKISKSHSYFQSTDLPKYSNFSAFQPPSNLFSNTTYFSPKEAKPTKCNLLNVHNFENSESKRFANNNFNNYHSFVKNKTNQFNINNENNRNYFSNQPNLVQPSNLPFLSPSFSSSIFQSSTSPFNALTLAEKLAGL